MSIIEGVLRAIARSRRMSASTKVRCSEDYFTALKASAQAATSFVVRPKPTPPLFMGMEIVVDPEFTGMQWEIQDQYGRVLQSSPTSVTPAQATAPSPDLVAGEGGRRPDVSGEALAKPDERQPPQENEG